MAFLAGGSTSAAAAVAPSAVSGPEAAEGVCAGATFGGRGFGASREARIREIGGRTVLFVLISPPSGFFCGAFLSISETVSTLGRWEGFGCGFSSGGRWPDVFGDDATGGGFALPSTFLFG